MTQILCNLQMKNDNCIVMISERHQGTKQHRVGHFTYITFVRYVVFVDDVKPTVFCVSAHITFTLTEI